MDAQSTHSMNRNFKRNKSFFIPLAVFLVLLIIGIGFLLKNATSGNNSLGNSDSRIELKKALATQPINKTFAFPLKDAAGKEVSKIQYIVEKAELRDEIIVKGQRATSVKGRTFLIIPVKIKNTYNQPVEINARDYIRLSINGSNENLAPDIHNDPVEVQAISTKMTRVGFPVDDTAKNMTIYVGEINGKKETIRLSLTK
jgi:hypothetical protein